MLKTVRVPEEFVPVFNRAQEYVQRFFAQRREDATQGTIEIFGERYMLMRCSSISVDFFEMVRGLYTGRNEEEGLAVARSLLFDMAHTIGLADARMFHERMGVVDPVERLSAGPVHFSHTGWAFVDILPDSDPTPSEDYYLLYDHPQSFEADAWLRTDKQVDFNVCVMNAGYSSGWCEQSFGIPLVSTEVTCRARGDDRCRFIMAHPNQIEQRVEAYAEAHPELASRSAQYQLPRFFSRKLAQEELQKAYNQLELKVSERTAEIQRTNAQLRAEMTERERAEGALKLSYAFLEIANRHTQMDDLLQEYLEELKKHSGCQALGIAVFDQRGGIAHHVCTGASVPWVECAFADPDRNNLCLNVIRGRAGSREVLLTRGGVFYLNRVAHYLDTLGDERVRTCEACNQFGFESLALAPVRAAGAVAGLIHVADPHPDRVHARLVEVLEIASMQLGEAISRVRTQAALQEGEEIYRTLVETAPDGIALLDHRGRVIKANERVAQMHGYEDPGQLTGITGTDLVAPVDRARAQANLEQVREQEGPSTEEYKFIRRDGTTYPGEATVARVPPTAGALDHYMIVMRDISRRIQVQANLAQSDRMASVGMLAAGVAHEINNPLAYVLLNVESLSEEIPRLTGVVQRLRRALSEAGGAEALAEALGDDQAVTSQEVLSDLLDQAQEAAEGARRVRNIVRDLKTFSSDPDDAPLPLSLNQAMDSAINMAFNEIKYRARLVKDYAKLPEVLFNEGQISQVFLNRLVNAAHSIDEGDVANNEIRVSTRVDGEFVEVEVRDTGRGIPRAQLDRVFEPFFTSKPVGLGTGLGLTICHNIVTAAGGTIAVDSERGDGATFLVRLPLRKPEEIRPVSGPYDPVTGPDAARCQILVVDNEPIIASTVRRLLKQEHDVTVVLSGAEARSLLEGGAQFDIILCDLMMPEVTGMDLHEWATAQRPELVPRMVFMTGGVFTPRSRDFTRSTNNPTLLKPFEPDELRALVQRLQAKFAALAKG